MSVQQITEISQVQNDKKNTLEYVQKEYHNIPQELKDLRQWVCIDTKLEKIDGVDKLKKFPKNPHSGYNAKSDDSKTWGTFNDALAGCQKYHYDHIGFAFSETDDYLGIDIDKCVNPDGTFSPIAQEVLTLFPGNYAEYSTSRTGVHLIVKGTIPETGCNGRKDAKSGIEIYTAKRIFVCTGAVITDKPNPILNQQEQINVLYDAYFKREEPQKQFTPPPSLSMSDNEVIAKARNAKNGSKFSALYDKGISGHTNNDDSSADLALCSILAFYTQDSEQIDRLFRNSKLMRKKWERKDYRGTTINKAIEGCSEYYKPSGYNHQYNGQNATSISKPNIKKEDVQSNSQEAAPNIEESSNKFRFLHVNSLIKTPKPTKWIIKAYLEAESLSMLFGESGGMKSFVGIDIGLSVASGLDWHGSQVRESGPVFYIAGEGFAGISRRLKAWTQVHNINPEEIPFFVSNQPAQLLNESSAHEVMLTIDGLQKEHGKPTLVIVDTLNRNFGDGDENSTEDMTAFINSIGKIKMRFGCAILIVHHSPLNDPNRARGASALRAALDWEFCLKTNGDLREFKITKVKDHEKPPDISFRPIQIALDGWIDEEDGTIMTSCVLTSINNDNKIQNRELIGSNKIALDCLIKLWESGEYSYGVPESTWRASAYTAGISTGTQEAKKKAFQRVLKFLEENQYVVGKNDIYKPIGTRDKGGT